MSHRITRVAAATVAVFGVAGASFASAAPSFEEFAASTYQDTDKQYIVNGDEPLSNKGELKDYYT